MKAEDKIFTAFSNLKERKLYYNQIKEYTQLSHSSLQNALDKLKKSKILEEEKTKSNKYYNIKDKKRASLKFSEIAIKKFESLDYNIKTPLNNFLKNINEETYSIILFGSVSRGEHSKDSDIDLLIISNHKQDLSKNKEEAEITSILPISIFQATISQFKKNEDDVIVQAKKTGFPIYKEQNFYEVILNES